MIKIFPLNLALLLNQDSNCSLSLSPLLNFVPTTLQQRSKRFGKFQKALLPYLHNSFRSTGAFIIEHYRRFSIEAQPSSLNAPPLALVPGHCCPKINSYRGKVNVLPTGPPSSSYLIVAVRSYRVLHRWKASKRNWKELNWWEEGVHLLKAGLFEQFCLGLVLGNNFDAKNLGDGGGGGWFEVSLLVSFFLSPSFFLRAEVFTFLSF